MQVIEMSFQQDKIRNFSIVAHIDHGKSTLADRILEQTQSVAVRDMEDQLLDDMELERERGITIKSHAVTLEYNADDGETYRFNLIDTPGHVDFNYEVSRSLAACEGAILVVDASQGIEAQTLANTYLAVDAGLEIVPVINKIDLPSADPERVINEIEDVIGIPAEDAPCVSAKAGINIHAVLEKIVSDIPAPTGDIDAPLRAMIFDSIYDSYKGVIIYVRLKEGQIHVGDEFRLMATGSTFNVVECGYMRATSLEPREGLYAGEVGYITASIKSLQDAQVGDTVTLTKNPAEMPLPGYRKVQSMVFCGIYPVDGARYGDLRDALDKLKLNDASLSYEPETSVALGFGYRCGFLGLLHMEIIQERLEREYNLDLITTAPSVNYRITLTDGSVHMISNPTNYPDPAVIKMAEEPVTDAHIYSPSDYVGNIMELCQDRRGVFIGMDYIDSDRVDIHYELPLAEIIYDFFDTLKSRTRGYASFDYEFKEYRESKLVKLDIMLNGETVDALSFIIHADKAYPRARKMAEKLKENIPRQLFEVPVQACIGGKIIARETVKAMRKDVLAKCYGGDISRKKKLLEKQKEGKKRMRQLGSVEVPQEAFMAVLKLDTD
ncbi:MAG: translation elongation factor 4 [Ruminococcus sp.]|nr:translation elongation factor 4 [Ruminococcus sp.]